MTKEEKVELMKMYLAEERSLLPNRKALDANTVAREALIPALVRYIDDLLGRNEKANEQKETKETKEQGRNEYRTSKTRRY